MKRFCSVLLAAAGVLLIFWGCVNLGEGTEQRTRFYVLRSLPESGERSPLANCENGIKVGLGPVHFPEYLHRPQIVTRIRGNELEINEFHRWAEPLDESFLRTLGQNLSILLCTNHVFVYPWKPSTAMDCQVIVDVTRFDGVLGQDVTLRVIWTVYDRDGRKILIRKIDEYKEPVKENGYDALISAYRRSLERLSHEIAAGIKELVDQRTQKAAARPQKHVNGETR